MFLRSPVVRFAQFYSTPAAAKSNIQLVAELRKLTSAPITKARQALSESNGDLQVALKWLEKDMAESGAAKAEKVKGRPANEGLVAASVAGSRSAIVELNCESDFVARTDDFGRLATNIARTVAEASKMTSALSFTSLRLADVFPLQLVNSKKTVEASILDIIARIGENISLRRAMTVTYDPESRPAGAITRVGTYAHNSSTEFPLAGKMAGLTFMTLRPKLPGLLSDLKFITDLGRIDRAIARQVVGFNPYAVGDATTTDEMHLYAQAFMMHGGPEASMLVRDVLAHWRTKWELESCDVDGFVRWEVGEERRLIDLI